MKDRIRHAFAVDPPGPATPTPEQERAIDCLCQEIVRRHLTTAAITFLEMSRPLNYMFAQTMHFTQPAAAIVVRLVRLIASKPDVSLPENERLTAKRLTEGDWNRLAAFFEKRGSIDYVCRRIEHFEEEYSKRERKRRQKPEEENQTPDA